MTKEEARAEAVRRWGEGSLAVLGLPSRYIVAGPDNGCGSVKGVSPNSWEAAFADADRSEAGKERGCGWNVPVPPVAAEKEGK